jgi:hypothetical protein
VADLPLQFPELAVTDMLLYVPIAGLFQFGALVQSRPLITAMSLQVTVGGFIVVPTLPIEGTSAQVSMYVIILELLLDVTDELLGVELAMELELETTKLELLSLLLLPPPSSPDEQPKVKAKASPKAASLANKGQADPARTMSCLIVCSPFLKG